MARGISSRDFDKFSKAYVGGLKKSLEQAARRNPPRVQIQAESSTSAGVLSRNGSIESSVYLAQLLMWLDAHHQQRPAEYVDVTRFVEEHQLEDEDPTVLALQLEQYGLVNIARDMTGATDVHLTDEGVVAVQRLKNLQKDRAARLRHTMDAFLRWLYDTTTDHAPINPALFLATPGAYFAGAEITGTDLNQALSYIAEHELIEAIDTDPTTIAITPQGVSCALAGGSVQDHINQQSPGDNITFHIGANTGNIAANSRDFTMNATTNKDGIDPAAVVMLARALRQAAPILELPEDDAIEFTQLATRIESEAASGSPDLGRLQRWGASVIGILNSPVVSGALGSVLAAYTGVVLPGLPSA
ncbi:hypothetical protein ADL25_40945 [Streptomyces sp. NRRL F-5122]|uniref:hypothetical protein n=1 Tax=Streptomyces sp. NRRL F-5122 TaxID=1609098 RepID=UPI000740DB1A|nr:hypothetical protein [Streptomyces sp. NRRL F-5122]KUJ34466.1 hypothetical protein ADL25_40945 [Streptomyces sp. NRRL F-5122]